MTERCSRHREPGDPVASEILWALLIPIQQTALILCDAGHYVRVRGTLVHQGAAA